jgi:uncharacterized ubiquitin-like protein YukD
MRNNDEYIIVTLSYNGAQEDLKIPVFVPVKDLIEVFVELFQVKGTMLHAEPKGIILDRGKTLKEQGIEYGARLTLS